MKGKLRFRSVVAVMLAFVLVVVGLNPTGLIREVNAAELKSITWTDFTNGGAAVTDGQEFTEDSYISYASGSNLNDTSFVGDVKIPSGGGFRYATPYSPFGLTFKESDGKLLIGGDGSNIVLVDGKSGAFDDYPFTLSAGDYKLDTDTFANTRFTIQIDFYNLAANNQSATVDIYVNGYEVKTGVQLTTNYIESSPTTTILGNGVGLDAGVTVYRTKPTLTPITWTDFTYNGSAVTDGQKFTEDSYISYASGSNLNNTSFVGDVKIPSGGGFRYAAPWLDFGLTFKESDGKLLIGGDGSNIVLVDGKSGAFDGYPFTLSADDYKLDTGTFVNTRFTIQIDFYDLAANNQSATVDIYVNGYEVKTGVQLTTNYAESSPTTTILGNGVGLDAGVTVYRTKPTLTPITWTDFTNGGAAVTDGQEFTEDSYISYASGSNLNNTSFVGDVKIPSGGGFRYATPYSPFGLTFKESDGKLLIGGDGSNIVLVDGKSGAFDDYPFTLSAGDYKLDTDTFANTRFTIQIDFYDLTANNQSATVDIYVNGYEVKTGVQLTTNYIESSPTTTILGNGVGLDAGVTVYRTKPTLTPITWDDFSANTFTGEIKGRTYETESWVKYTTGDSLNNTVFEDYIIFSSGASMTYATTGAWFGLRIGVNTDDQLFVRGDSYTDNGTNFNYTYAPSEFELTTLTDTRLPLRIEMRDVTESTANVTVYVNGCPAGDEIVLTKVGSTSSLGTIVAFCVGDTNAVTIPNSIPVPTDLTPLSWEEFGFTGGQTYTSQISRSALHLDNLNGTLFSGDIMMTANSEFIYGASDANWRGVKLMINADGTLTMDAFGSVTPFTVSNVNPKHYGLTKFENNQFNIKIAITDWSGSYESSSTRTVCVWINDQILGNAFTFTQYEDSDLGTTLHMCTAAGEDSITPYSSRTTVPTDLEKISFEDWMEEEALLDGHLNNFEINGENPNVETLLGTTLSEVVKFVGEETDTRTHAFTYGGHKENGQNYGIYIQINAKNMYINCSDAGLSFTLDPSVAGVGTSFANTEFSWRIDTKKLGDSNNILLYISFNGVLYNNAPFVIYNFADKISNTMVYNSIETQDSELAKTYYTVLGPSIKTLPVLYHDLAEGNYTIPAYNEVTFYKQDANGGWVLEATPTTLTETGNYKLEFNDGVSNYIQEIACYYYEKDVSAASLVRSLKMKQTDKTTYEEYGEGYETRLCDTNYDGKVDADDIDDIKSMLLETYEADTNVMRISGFFSPTASLIEDATYQNIKAIGVNHIIESDTAYSDDPLARYRTYQELAYAQKYGMKVTVRDARLIAKVVKSTDNAEDQKAEAAVDTDITKEEVEESVVNYKYYQSFDSLFLIDEPKSAAYPNTGNFAGMRQVELYTQLATAIKEAGYDLWTNAFGGDHGLLDNGYNSTVGTRMRNGYYKYLQQLVNDFGLDYISFTEYPFVRTDEDSVAALRTRYTTIKDNELIITSVAENSSEITDMDAVLLNLALAKNVSEKAVEGKTLEFRTFVAATASTESGVNHNFNDAQMKWQANMNLAFGSDVLQYFTLVPASKLQDYNDGTCASGLLDEAGNISEFGTWATSVNKQAAAIDDILKGATHKGFMAVGTYAEDAETTVESIKILTGSRWDFMESQYTTLTNDIHDTYAGASFTLSENTYGAFAGCFEISENEHAMYIVNFSDVNENTVTVSCGTSAITAIYQGKETEYTGSAEITLAPGEAVLVVY